MVAMVTRHRVIFVPLVEPVGGDWLHHLETALDLIAAEGWDTFALVQGTGSDGESGFLVFMRQQVAVN